MTYLSINDLYYKHEGFGTLMGHYASMYSIYLDTGSKPIIPKSMQKFQPNSAMEFFNTYTNSLDHSEAFTNFKNIFNIIDEEEYTKINWRSVNFSGVSYDKIIQYVKNNSDTNFNFYWSLNSKLYWNHIDKIINHLYLFNDNLIDECKNYLPKTTKNTVAVSIRNQYKKFSCPHSKLSINYYLEAMNQFDISNTKFIIFSDYIDESKEMLSDLQNIYDIEYTNQMPSAHGMCCMSLCDNIINANSSFSYWAGILNKNPNKKIICPTKFIDESIDYNLAQSINHKWYPEEWIGLDSV